MSSVASKAWTRMSTLGRDSVTFGRTLFHAVGPIITTRRHETAQQRLTLGDAFRNAVVTEAQKSNSIATRLLSWQQQIGLLQYHGMLGYWRQRQGSLLQATTTAAAAASNNINQHGTAASPTSDTIGTSPSLGKSSSNVSVAKVAFMITASMRKELSERLTYTAEDIKAMTPLEASLLLHHSVKPTEKEKVFPGLLQAHEEEQEIRRQEQARIQEEEEMILLLSEQQEKQKKEALVADPEGTMDVTVGTLDSSPPVSQNNAPIEGLFATQEASVERQVSEEAARAKQPDAPPLGYSLEFPTRYSSENARGLSDNDNQPPLGSFAAAMEATVDRKREWYEVVESRTDDNTSTPVGLFSDMHEAEMAMDLKTTFAARRAKEDHHNLEDVPATTYTLHKTIK
jgi:hypothetical protein